MYVTVIDYSIPAVRVHEWDIEHDPTTEETEGYLADVGYHISQISFMTSEEMPDIEVCGERQ